MLGGQAEAAGAQVRGKGEWFGKAELECRAGWCCMCWKVRQDFRGTGCRSSGKGMVGAGGVQGGTNWLGMYRWVLWR